MTVSKYIYDLRMWLILTSSRGPDWPSYQTEWTSLLVPHRGRAYSHTQQHMPSASPSSLLWALGSERGANPTFSIKYNQIQCKGSVEIKNNWQEQKLDYIIILTLTKPLYAVPMPLCTSIPRGLLACSGGMGQTWGALSLQDTWQMKEHTKRGSGKERELPNIQ